MSCQQRRYRLSLSRSLELLRFSLGFLCVFSQMFDSCETSFMKHFILKIPYEHIHTCVCVSAAANVETTSLIK